MTHNDIVQKLWNLCDVLRDDGINYSDYVTELVLLLFVKMEYEQVRNSDAFEHKLPAGSRWPDLNGKSGLNLLNHYRQMLLDLGKSSDPMIAAIYADAQTRLKEPRHLETLVTALDGLDWFSARQDGLGDLYEGLLQKNANETKSGAGQYFTPRALIDAIIRCLQPQPGETLQDPAAGTAGFLIAADAYIKANTDDLYTLDDKARRFQQQKAYTGMEPGARHPPPGADELPAARHVRRRRGRGPARQQPRQCRRRLAQGGHHPVQPAVRHRQGRRRTHP